MAMGVVEIGVVVQRVLVCDPGSCDLAGARARLDDVRRVESFFAARAAAYQAIHDRLLAEAAASGAGRPGPDLSGAAGSAGDAPVDLPRLPPLSSREARRLGLRAKWLARCPLFADGLATGEVSPALVDALAGVLDQLEPPVMAHLLGDEAGLMRLAAGSTPDGFRHFLRQLVDEARADFGMRRLERQRKNSSAWTRTGDDGLYHLSVTLDPERGQVVFAAIEQRLHQLQRQAPDDDRRSISQLRLQAVIDLVCGTATVVPEVLVVVDERTIRIGPHAGTMCETEAGVPLPASLAVNWCAHAKVTAAIVAADGNVIAEGCAARTANRKQRRALRAMYRTCAHPDCSRPFTECEMHHVIHWEHGGPTKVANLAPLCFEHHHLVHEDGWYLTIDDQRTLRWYRPDGTLERTAPLQPLLERQRLRAVERIDPTASETSGVAGGRGPPSLFDPNAA